MFTNVLNCRRCQEWETFHSQFPATKELSQRSIYFFPEKVFSPRNLNTPQQKTWHHQGHSWILAKQQQKPGKKGQKEKKALEVAVAWPMQSGRTTTPRPKMSLRNIFPFTVKLSDAGIVSQIPFICTNLWYYITKICERKNDRKMGLLLLEQPLNSLLSSLLSFPNNNCLLLLWLCCYCCDRGKKYIFLSRLTNQVNTDHDNEEAMFTSLVIKTLLVSFWCGEGRKDQVQVVE